MTIISKPAVNIQIVKNNPGGQLSSSASNTINPAPPGIVGLMLLGSSVSPYIHAYNPTAGFVDTIDDLLPEALTGQVSTIALSSDKRVLVFGGTLTDERPKVYNVSTTPWTDISDTVLPASWTLGKITCVRFSEDNTLVIMLGEDDKLYVFDRSSGDGSLWTKQTDSVFRTAYAQMNATMINDQWDMDIKGDFLLIGRNASYTGSITTVPNAVVYDLTTNPITEVTGLICAERSFNAGVVYCTSVSWHPIDNVITLAVQNDNGIRTAVFTYDEFMVFTEIDNYVTPEPSINGIAGCCFSPSGTEVLYASSNSPFVLRYEATSATGNTALSTTPITSFANSRLCMYNELGSLLAFGANSSSDSIYVVDTATGVEVEFLSKPTNTASVLFT